eukprot:gene12525-13810_t
MSHNAKGTSSKKMHYQLTSSMASRLQKNAALIKNGIVKHCIDDLSSEDCRFVNVASNMAVSPVAEIDIIERDQKAEEAFKDFVANQLKNSTAKMSMWDPIIKLRED